MAKAKSENGKADRKAEAKRIAHLIQRTIDEGADSVEEIHRSIASMPLDVLERLDVFKDVVKDVRRVQDTSIGAIYRLIHKVNDEVARLATEMLREKGARKQAPTAKRKPTRAAPASAHAR
jgi:hypothetical protein